LAKRNNGDWGEAARRRSETATQADSHRNGAEIVVLEQRALALCIMVMM
jgi:hypothetical protein